MAAYGENPMATVIDGGSSFLLCAITANALTGGDAARGPSHLKCNICRDSLVPEAFFMLRPIRGQQALSERDHKRARAL